MRIESYFSAFGSIMLVTLLTNVNGQTPAPTAVPTSAATTPAPTTSTTVVTSPAPTTATTVATLAPTTVATSAPTPPGVTPSPTSPGVSPAPTSMATRPPTAPSTATMVPTRVATPNANGRDCPGRSKNLKFASPDRSREGGIFRNRGRAMTPTAMNGRPRGNGKKRAL